MKNNTALKYSHGGDLKIPDLFSAIKEVDIDSIRSILDENREALFIKSENNQFPLEYACFVGNLTSAQALFEYIDVNDAKFTIMLDKALVRSLALGHKGLIDLVSKKTIGWDVLQDKPTPTPKPF